MPGSRSSSAATRLVLPPPDGAASTNRQPEAGGALVGVGSGAALAGAPWVLGTASLFHVLHLLAHLLDQHLELERRLRELRVHRLGPERVRLAVQFLHEEVESLA